MVIDMPKRYQPEYHYECPFWNCHKSVGSDVGPSQYPECNGTHSKLMDFIEAKSKSVPSHITNAGQKPTQPGSDSYKVNGGNWIGA